jgi:hypothetical protein
VAFCKYIGVIMDENLEWSLHIELINQKLVKNVDIFCKLRNRLPDRC